MKKILQNKRKILTIVIILITLGGYGLSYYLYSQNQSLKKNPDQVAQEQTTMIIAQVAKIMQLPTDESPSVVTVNDKSKVAGQPFFKNVENGDALLVYSKNLQAILYRPSTNMIIQVGPVYNDNNVTDTSDKGNQIQATTTSQAKAPLATSSAPVRKKVK
jgi:type II secretory pathway pseudopilin PulG